MKIRAPSRQDREFMNVGSSKDKEFRPRLHNAGRGPEFCSLGRNCLVDGSTDFRTFQTLSNSGPKVDLGGSTPKPIDLKRTVFAQGCQSLVGVQSFATQCEIF
jgi:hypothetical protein